jgi:tetratricopeptide (TPR) repeat protein
LSLQPPWTGRYARGLLHVALREHGAALDVARELERPAEPGLTQTPRDDTLLVDLRRQLARVIRVRALEQAGDARAALELLGEPALPSLRVLPGTTQHPTAQERFLRARLLERLGRTEESLRWLSSIPDPSGYDAVYLAPSHLLRARIYDERGDSVQAVRHYARVLELWSNADAELQPLVRTALARLERLRG